MGAAPLSAAGSATWRFAPDDDLTWERDEEHFPAALPPLVADFVQLGVSAGWSEAYERRGMPVRPRYVVLNGFVYWAWRVLPPPPGGPSTNDIAASRNRAAAADLDGLWRTGYLPRLKAHYRALTSAARVSAPAADMADTWQAAWRDAAEIWTIHFSVDGPAYRAMADLVDAWKALPPPVSDADPASVLRSRRGGMYRFQRDLERLTRLARDHPAAWAAARDRIIAKRAATSARAPAATAQRALRAFIRRHGHLGSAFIDLRLPGWSERPELLVDVVSRGLAGANGSEDFESRSARLNGAADALWRRARHSLRAGADRASLDAIVRRARQAAWLTQEHCYWIDLMHAHLMRRLALGAGQQLARSGCIDGRDDVFLLHAAEATRLLRQPADSRSLVEERRRLLVWQEQLDPPHSVGPPSGEPAHAAEATSGVEPASAALFAVDDLLSGEPGAPGVGRGLARLVISNDDLASVGPGDVLVCSGSNPSWVPFMAMASALVAEWGGPACHAAIIARELGIPAVVGVAGALRRISSGQLIEVDGSQGTVRTL